MYFLGTKSEVSQCSVQSIVGSKGLLFAVLFRRVCSMMFSCVTYLETTNNTFDVFCSIVTCGPYYLIFFFRRFELKGLKVRLMVLNVRFMKTFSCWDSRASKDLQYRIPLAWKFTEYTVNIGDIDVGDGCWRQNVLVTSLRFWWQIKYIDKITNITKKVTNIMILPSKSKIGHHHLVTNITMSSTSLSPQHP